MRRSLSRWASFELGRDQAPLRDAVAKLCEHFPGSYWQQLDAKRKYPHEFVSRVTADGYMGALIPTKYGGSGLGLRSASLILQTIHESGCSASAIHAGLYIMSALVRHGTEQQKQAFLPKIASVRNIFSSFPLFFFLTLYYSKGELSLKAFGVTEATSGSETLALRTTAERVGDEFEISGHKTYISRAQQSDLMLLLARTSSDATVKPAERLSLFLVDLKEAQKRNEIEIVPIRTMINHHANEVFIDKLRVSEDALVGREGQGFKCVLDGMNAERILLASEALGDGLWFLNTAVDYAKERTVFGRPIGQNQSISFPLAESYAELSAVDLSIRQAIALFESGDASLVRFFLLLNYFL
jgi:acyl-CoA dehydrogenase